VADGQQESEVLRAFKEIYEEGNRAWNEGNLKTAYAALPDQLEYILSPTWPDARVLRSRDEVIAFFEEFQSTFPDAETAAHEYIETDDGTIIVGFRVTGSGRSSGAGAEMEIWQVWQVHELEDGLTATSVREFNDRQEAMDAAGAGEPAGRETK
jgi:ketosteroid isomerase-like protein